MFSINKVFLGYEYSLQLVTLYSKTSLYGALLYGIQIFCRIRLAVELGRSALDQKVDG